MELATRFLVHSYVPYDGTLDVEEYVDKGIVELAERGPQDEAGTRFTETFSLLKQSYGENALRRLEGDRHTGRVTLVAFECIAVGIGKSIAPIRALDDPVDFVKQKVASFWNQPEIENFLSRGMRGTTRIQRTVPFGANWFQP